MRLAFMADLHLSPDHPELVQGWQQKLRTLRGIDALYILGDLFEVWLGDDDCSPFNQNIQSSLAEASRHYAIYVQRGNRDFLLGDDFARRSGIQLLADEVIIADTLLLHGDQLCTLDTVYQQAKAELHQRRDWFLAQPLAIRKQLAQQYRQQSQKHIRSQNSAIMNIEQNTLDQLLDQHGVDQVIHGHTHRPAYHQWLYQGRIRKRWVLPDWRHQKTPALIWDGAAWFWL